jgi:hypothetical protein
VSTFAIVCIISWFASFFSYFPKNIGSRVTPAAIILILKEQKTSLKKKVDYFWFIQIKSLVIFFFY